MSHELEQCKSHCEKGPFCPGEDCFQKGFNAGFSEKSSLIIEIDKLRQLCKEAQKQLEELMEDAKKLIV
jgi:hypothetical protein